MFRVCALEWTSVESLSSLLSFFITHIARKLCVVMETKGRRLPPGCFLVSGTFYITWNFSESPMAREIMNSPPVVRMIGILLYITIIYLKSFNPLRNALKLVVMSFLRIQRQVKMPGSQIYQRNSKWLCRRHRVNMWLFDYHVLENLSQL